MPSPDLQRCPSQAEGIPSQPSAPSTKRQSVLAVGRLFLFFLLSCHSVASLGALSCAECRRYAFAPSPSQSVYRPSSRLKLKCDKTVPCSRYRGRFPNASGLVCSLFIFKLQTQGLLRHLSQWKPHHWAGHPVGHLSRSSVPSSFPSSALSWQTRKNYTQRLPR